MYIGGMDMYESLTSFIPALKDDKYGEWVIDKVNKGTIDNPIHMPYVKYSSTIRDLEKAIYRFIDEHKEYELTNYQDILNKVGISWGSDSMKEADVSTLDGRTVMALLVGAIRAERFCDGALLGFCKDGSIVRWLERLREIDEE